MRRLFLNATVSVVTFVSSILLSNFTRPGTELAVPDFIEPGPVSTVLSTAPSVDEMELREIYRQYGPAQNRHDTKFFERIEAEEFMLFSDGEKPLTRSEDIKAMNEAPLGDKYSLQLVDISFHGDGAVVRSEMTVVEHDGDVISWPTIDVWVKRNGHWQILSTTQLD